MGCDFRRSSKGERLSEAWSTIELGWGVAHVIEARIVDLVTCCGP
jgi:hypothetical protein